MKELGKGYEESYIWVGVWGLGSVFFCFSFLGKSVDVRLGLGLRNRIDDEFGFGKATFYSLVVLYNECTFG